ncbi:MAG: precorrin-4 C(11)-methyltransferase [Gammaproteobacteria bacterium]|nr:precorrin-4 C(11)-methyltransferase [Gammaproteobacteria bacterium]
MKVYFIGAGPGDPDLITVKGLRLIQQAPVIIYAGSLVPEEILREARSDAQIVNSAELHLEQIIELIKIARDEGKIVARVHSGDPSVYGAIGEQIRQLEKLGIDYEVVPGVTATSASAAALGKELTLAGVSQTIIMTRYAGKTSMPDGEDLSSLAAHKATLVIHLGVTRIHKIVEELIPHYGTDCPIAVLYRTGWQDADRVTGTLTDIVDKVRAKGFSRTSLIIVGRVLDTEQFDDSFLYRADKAHVYRPRVPKKESAD